MSTVEELSQNERPCDIFKLWQCYAKPELTKLIFPFYMCHERWALHIIKRKVFYIYHDKLVNILLYVTQAPVAYRRYHRARACVWSAEWKRFLTAGRGWFHCKLMDVISAVEVSSTSSGSCRPLTARLGELALEVGLGPI